MERVKREITRDDLRNYQELLIELDGYDVRIAQAYNTYRSPTMSSDGGGHSSDPSDPTSRAFQRIEQLKADRQRVQEQINAIESFVSTIDDPRERTICNLHYICGYTWQATCWRMRKHYSSAMLVEYDRRWWDEQEKESETSEKEKKAIEI